MINKSALAIFSICLFLFPFIGVRAENAAFVSGDLVKTKNYSGVYLIDKSGSRHLFPNAATFWSWYSGTWGDIKLDGLKVKLTEIDDSVFETFPAGKNITVKPGKILAFPNSSKVYVTFVNTLDSSISLKSVSRQEAATYFGSDWEKRLITIQEGFEGDYIHNDEKFLDSDGDGLDNMTELSIYKSETNNIDSDGDGFNDGREVLFGYSPTVNEGVQAGKETVYSNGLKMLDYVLPITGNLAFSGIDSDSHAFVQTGSNKKSFNGIFDESGGLIGSYPLDIEVVGNKLAYLYKEGNNTLRISFDGKILGADFCGIIGMFHSGDKLGFFGKDCTNGKYVSVIDGVSKNWLDALDEIVNPYEVIFGQLVYGTPGLLGYKGIIVDYIGDKPFYFAKKDGKAIYVYGSEQFEVGAKIPFVLSGYDKPAFISSEDSKSVVENGVSYDFAKYYIEFNNQKEYLGESPKFIPTATTNYSNYARGLAESIYLDKPIGIIDGKLVKVSPKEYPNDCLYVGSEKIKCSGSKMLEAKVIDNKLLYIDQGNSDVSYGGNKIKITSNCQIHQPFEFYKGNILYMCDHKIYLGEKIISALDPGVSGEQILGFVISGDNVYYYGTDKRKSPAFDEDLIDYYIRKINL